MTRFAICDDQEEHCERLECYIISEYDKYIIKAKEKKEATK